MGYWTDTQDFQTYYRKNKDKLVAKIEFGIGDDDRKRLLSFVDSLQLFLGGLVEQGDYFDPKFRDDYKIAWAELNPHFYALKDALQRVDTNTLLSQGLFGNPLGFKLKVINHFAEEFRLYGLEISGGHKLLDKLLQAINRLLSGLVLTAGAGMAIESFNSFMIAIIKDDG
jgi:hypothetical protein